MLLKKRIKVLWTDIVQSISGNEQDFTQGSITKAIVLLSIPMVLEMIMESVFAVVDIFFVSKLGADAVAAVGITESLITIVYALGLGFSIGTTALIARRIGEKKNNEASIIAVQSIIVGIAVSIVITIIGILFSKDLLILMGASEKAVEIGADYTLIMLSTNVVIMLLFIINAVFRSAGDANISMKVLWLANGINIILDPCLIFGWGFFPELGVKGAAIATSIGRGIAIIVQIYFLFKGSKRIKITIKHLKVNFQIIRKLIKVSIGGIGQFIISTSSWIFLIKIIASFGSIVVAGYTIAIRIILFVLLPSWGMGNAVATLTGQNLGAKKPERAVKTVYRTALINLIFLSSAAIILIIFAENWLKLFIDDTAVIEKGAVALRYISFALFLYSIGMILIQAFNGSGKTQIPTLLNFICFWLLEIPLAYFLSIYTSLNEKGVYVAIICGDVLLTIIGIYLFKRGNGRRAKYNFLILDLQSCR